MKPTTLPQLAELESLRGNPIIFYSSTLGDDSLRVMYECLRKQGKTENLDLILTTMGGSVIVTRQLALLLREYTQYLTILVPYHAKSSGTLLCLCADKLVLGPMAELGPIDPQVSSAGPTPPDAPGMISAQDIQGFREMAEKWFGVTREEDRLQVLALIAQRVFPTSLSSFYRYEQLLDQLAGELLRYQLPNTDAQTRQIIVNQLIKGYHSHDYVITRREARELGLQVQFASEQEEFLMWDLLRTCRLHRTEHPDQAEEEIIGFIASAHFSARQISRWIETPPWQRSTTHDRGAFQPDKMNSIQWEIEI